MLRPEVLRKRLDKLEEYLVVLDRARGYDLESFLADPERYGSAERFLQLAIEAVVDMGAHVIADLGLGTVDAAADIPRLMRAHGHVDEELENRWIRMIGFRNILVHEYLDVDRAIVHAALRDGLEDLRALAGMFAGFL